MARAQMSSLLVVLSYAMLITPSIQTPQSSKKNIFILAGQSNMAGEGGIVKDVWDGIVPPQCKPNSPVLRLTAELKWEEAHEPLHAGINKNRSCGVGPGMSFANAVLKKDPNFGVVGLVPCAKGRTGMDQWAKGGDLYARLVKRAGAALQDGGSIGAILWYQGESDTGLKRDADTYKDKLKTFFTNVRTDLNCSTLPIYQVALATSIGPYLEVVRQAQFSVCKELENVKCVDAKGLPVGPDTIHLNTPAQVQLGNMLANAFYS